MKNFTQSAAQGDILIRRIESIPATAIEVVDQEVGPRILAHSETGHHHVVDRASTRLYTDTNNPLISYLKVCIDTVNLEHRRNFDKHEDLVLTEGFYELRRQREWAPEGWRAVED
jgi:hypothetical protein